MNVHLIVGEVVVEVEEEVWSLSLLQDLGMVISLHLIVGEEVEVVRPLKQEQVLYLIEKKVWSLKWEEVEVVEEEV